MWAFPPAALLFCAAAGGFDVNGSVISEGRVGEAPLLTGGAPRAGVAAIFTPTVEAQYVGRRFLLHLDYGPRFFWRQPNEASRDAPLILHTANLATSFWASREIQLTGTATLAAGEADYTSLSLFLPTNQATVPTASVSNLLSVSSDVGVQIAITREWLSGVTGRVTHRRPLGDHPPPVSGGLATTDFNLVKQTSLGLTPFVLRHLTRWTDITLSTPASYTTYDNGAYIYTGSPQLSFHTRLTRQWDLRASAGFSVARVSPPQSAPDPAAALPPPTAPPVLAPPAVLAPPVGASTHWGAVGGVEAGLLLLSRHDTAMRLSLAAAVDEFVDPILRVAGPRGSTSLRMTLLFVPAWTLGVEAAFATSLARKPIPGSDETFASASIPIRYRASDEVVIETGGRWLDRAPHLESWGPGFHQRQLWFYVMLFATSRKLPAWITP